MIQPVSKKFGAGSFGLSPLFGFDLRDLFGIVDLDARHVIDLFDRAGGPNLLLFEVFRRIFNSGDLKGLCARRGNDHGKVLLALKIGFRVEVNLSSFLQAIFGALNGHFDRYHLAHTLSGFNRGEGFVIIGSTKSGKCDDDQWDDEGVPHDQFLCSWKLESQDCAHAIFIPIT